MNNAETLRFIAQSLIQEPAVDLSDQITSGRIEWTRVVALASGHYVVPSLYPALEQRGLLEALPGDLLEYLQTVWSLNRLRNEGLRQQLIDLARVLNSAGIIPLPLKGANALLPNAWPGAFDRVLADLDILVPDALLAEAVAALQDRGYQQAAEVFRGGATLRRHHLLPLLHPDHPGYVELHRELALGAVGQLLPSAEIQSQAEPCDLDAARMCQPSPSWRLVHLLLHTCFKDGHFHRRSMELRQLNDWVQLRKRRDEEIDWPAMQRHLSDGGLAPVLPTYLALAEALFDQPPPGGVAIPDRALRTARQTLDALDNKWTARRFRTAGWLYRLPARLAAQRDKLMLPDWYGYRLRRLLSRNDC